MSTKTMHFKTPFLKGSKSPDHMTKAELDGGKVAIMASFEMDAGDELSFHIKGEGIPAYEKKMIVATGGAARDEAGTTFNSAVDWVLYGKEVTVYYTARRNNIPIGQSAEFRFNVAAS